MDDKQPDNINNNQRFLSYKGYQKSEFCLKQGRKISDFCLKAGTQGYIESPPPPPRGAQNQGHTFQFKCKEGKKQEMEYVAHITLL